MAMRTSPWKLVRQLSSQAAESPPTATSAWVDLASVGGHHFPQAKVFFTPATLANADNVIELAIWIKNAEDVITLAALASNDAGADEWIAVDLGYVGPVSFFVTHDNSTGTSPDVTTDMYVMGYDDIS